MSDKSFEFYVRPDDPPMCGNCSNWRPKNEDWSAGFCKHPNNQLEQSIKMKGSIDLVQVIPLSTITTDRTTCTQHSRKDTQSENGGCDE